MKKVLIVFLCLLSCITANADSKGLGLFFAYSMEENSYNDDNIKLEIIGNTVYLTNHLQEVVYLDPKKTFFYEAGSGVNKTNSDVILSVQPNSRVKIHTFYSALDRYVFTTRNDISQAAMQTVVSGTLEPLKGVKFLQALDEHLHQYQNVDGKFRVCPQDDAWFDFIGVVGDLYIGFTENKKKESTSIHLTKDESILTEKVVLAYSLNSDYSSPVSVTVSTWVSDVFLANYIVDDGGTKKSDGFSKRGSHTKISINAKSPFENLDDDQEASPIKCYRAAFGKGVFALNDIWANRGRVVFEGSK